MITVTTHPSLALIKYWGKADGGINLPASPSIAVGLEDLHTETRVSAQALRKTGQDKISIDGTIVADKAIESFLHHLRTHYPETKKLVFNIQTRNSFPTAAGLASSSSGFAALAIACTRAANITLSERELSQLARLGSGSAARAVFGGFTRFSAGSEFAQQIFPASHWPELCAIIVMIHKGKKPMGSRQAMEHTRTSSPYYSPWLEHSKQMEEPAIQAIQQKSLDSLGPIMRHSYLSMFGSMLAADPAIIYWLPDSLAIIHAAGRWRDAGLPVWETMDAGPQVKLFTLAEHIPSLLDKLKEEFPQLDTITTKIGGEPTIRIEDSKP